ncbi:hypothetical protein ABZ942_42030 [Nocardia sp. NPDC046473]|uniref:hypothetical protein n=1 Tax=Nocardia sp. NPDC046473 TaxID=3155733 RepID=UPI00340939AA
MAGIASIIGLSATAFAAADPTAKIDKAARVGSEQMDITLTYNCAEGTATSLVIVLDQTKPAASTRPSMFDLETRGTSAEIKNLTCNGAPQTKKVHSHGGPVSPGAGGWADAGEGEAVMHFYRDDIVVKAVKAAFRW